MTGAPGPGECTHRGRLPSWRPKPVSASRLSLCSGSCSPGGSGMSPGVWHAAPKAPSGKSSCWLALSSSFADHRRDALKAGQSSAACSGTKLVCVWWPFFKVQCKGSFFTCYTFGERGVFLKATVLTNGRVQGGYRPSSVSHSGMHLPLPEACSCHLSPPARMQVRHCPGVLTWQEGGRSLSRLPSDVRPIPTPTPCQGEHSSVSR